MEPMESNFESKRRAREYEVSVDDKQRLFQLAGDIILGGDAVFHEIVEPGKQYLDTNNWPAHYQVLEVGRGADEDWRHLRQLGVSYAVLYYWPERTCDNLRYDDQINIEVHYSDEGRSDLYTMKLASYTDSYEVKIGNRFEIHDNGGDWLEISSDDANYVKNLLTAIKKSPPQSLATE